MYGTCPCPQIVKTTFAENGGRVEELCPEVADVADVGGGEFNSTCPAGHMHSFSESAFAALNVVES